MINPKEYGNPFLEESLADYGEGGLYHIYINDKFQNGRYRILDRIGAGGYSTVWAVQDLQDDKLVSIKVVKARYSENNIELRILEHVRDSRTQHPGRQYIPTLLDHFYEGNSTGGRNLFLVLELLGPSVAAFRPQIPGKCFGASPKIPKQLLLAVDYLHEQGIVHGDIHDGNILFRYPEWWEPDLEDFERPNQGEVKRKDGRPLEHGVPKFLVQLKEFRFALEEDDFEDFDHIQLVDFSASFFSSDPPETTHTVLHMSPPELIFQKGLGKSMDIWNVACTIYTLVTGVSLFDVWTDKRELIPQIHRVIGETSAHWLLTALTEALIMKVAGYDWHDTLEKKLQENGGISKNSGTITEKKSAAAVISFLRKALVADPSKRATAKELRRGKWMRGRQFR
ncbi:kinase-like domain-containing protein [Lophiotrema nucula]|uniref:Kinase-like domain-containing protein n=1 Tax=Lophiotrema nucula TaxID=690887 RepID=A0A6A5YVM7_9PLEO|nr:kinase-like domain-containing protein [Lophiotrema nucula]